MAYLGYAFKKFFRNLFVVLLNGFYYCRFYCKVKRGFFDRDFSNVPEKDDWTITFQDEFEGTEIDWTRWNKWFSETQAAPSTETPVMNSTDCIELHDGQLHLYTKKNEDYPDNSPYPLKTGLLNSMYDSWCVDGEKKSKGWEQSYGYFETCCKVPPNGLTFWAAFWLYGNSWPPEIDIFEFMDGKDCNSGHSKGINMTLHWGPDGKRNMGSKATQLGRKLRRFFGAYVNFDEHFHTYAVRWEWDYVEWYIDNVAVYRSVYNIATNQMSIIINNGAKLGCLPKDRQLPQDFVVDYVRAYKKIED